MVKALLAFTFVVALACSMAVAKAMHAAAQVISGVDQAPK